MKRFLLTLAVLWAVTLHAADRPNILLLTVDDMSCDSVGVYGCKLPGTTPNMDRLAAQSLRFAHAHTTVGNCMPCRNVMFSGLHSHNNKIEGFYQVKNPGWPHMVDLMKDAGYFTGIRGKVSHSAPYQPYAWDTDLTTLPDGSKAHIKDVQSYGAATTTGIARAKAAKKPFCLAINISDPHKPFWKGPNDPHKPSRIFTADEVPIPGFLFDDPAVRQELALYYTSVRRADDAVGAVLKALETSGEADNTVVMFMSDHGMPLPFAKTQLYHHSTRTPWMVRWPGVTHPGSVDKQHMISVVDFLPTVLDITGIKHPKRLDGRSYLPLLLAVASYLAVQVTNATEEMEKKIEALAKAIANPLFPALDSVLRAGRHIASEDMDNHAYLIEFEIYKSGFETDDVIIELKIENLDRPNKSIIYPFSFLLIAFYRDFQDF